MLKNDYPTNIRNLLFKGFLTTRVSFADITLVLKTVNEAERDKTLFYSGEGNTKEAVIRQVMYSIFLVDDVNLLDLRNDPLRLDPIKKLFMSMNKEFLTVVLEKLARLNAWYFFEMRNIYRFSLERESRLIWPSVKMCPMNDSRITGIPGTDTIGVNVHQMQWRVYNELEDHEVLLKGIWQQAKFIASAVAGSKAIQKVNEHDKMAQEENERIKKRILRGEVGYTREDLVNETIDELERQIRGEKDEFDRFVEEEELTQKMQKVKMALRESIFSQEIFKLRDRDTYVIGDEEFEQLDEVKILDTAIDAVNRGSIRAELKMNHEQKLVVIGQVKTEVKEEIEVKYGELAGKD